MHTPYRVYYLYWRAKITGTYYSVKRSKTMSAPHRSFTLICVKVYNMIVSHVYLPPYPFLLTL